MAHLTIEISRKAAYKLAKTKGMFSESYNNSSAFYRCTDYSSLEWRNNEATISDASCANSQEIKDKYGVK